MEIPPSIFTALCSDIVSNSGHWNCVKRNQYCAHLRLFSSLKFSDSTTEKLFTFFLNFPMQNSKTVCFHEVQMLQFSFIEELHLDKAFWFQPQSKLFCKSMTHKQTEKYRVYGACSWRAPPKRIEQQQWHSTLLGYRTAQRITMQLAS